MIRAALALRVGEPGRADFMPVFAKRNVALWLLLAAGVAIIAPASVPSVAIAAADIQPHEASFDSAKIEPFRQKNEKYKTLEKQGRTPGPWQHSSWADGAVSEATLVTDAGDGKPAIRLVNLSGQPSGMFKPWTGVRLSRGTWEARVDYRKEGKASGRMQIDAPDNKKHGADLSPTGGAFKTVKVPFEMGGDGGDVGLGLLLYGGIGSDEALFIRSFQLVKVGDVGAETIAAEAQAAAALLARAQTVADREATRRAAERKPIQGWVRPEVKPVRMTKPLDPPPVTGTTYFVATDGNNDTGDGSRSKPWRTIQHGMNQLHPGDRLYLRGGEYRESMLTLARSGKPDAYITVAGYPGEQAKVINSGGLTVFNLDAGSPWTPKRLREEAYIVFRDLYVDAVKGNQTFRINGPMMLPEYGSDVVKSRGMRHNIWVVGCEIVGGGPAEGGIGPGFGAHDIVISNNRIHHISGGVMAYLYADGTIIEWNTVYNTGPDQDDAGAIKSMTPGVIIRYNTVYNNNRDPLSKKPGWAPDSEGGGQWRFLQGLTGIYLDWAMTTPPGGNGFYPEPLLPADPANYVYGNQVYNNNAGIYAYKSDNARIFDNVVYDNGRGGAGGWAEGKEGGKWLEFIGPAGYGIAATASKNVQAFGNVVYNNRLGGLTTETVPGFQAYDNVLFGNDLAQIHVRKGDEGAFGFNKIVAAPKQGAPFRRVAEDFATPAAYREKYPYQDEGTEIVPLAPGTRPLALAEKLRKERLPPHPCGKRRIKSWRSGRNARVSGCRREPCRRRRTTRPRVYRRRSPGGCRASWSSRTTMSAVPASRSKITTPKTRATTTARTASTSRRANPLAMAR
jgi:parallel beta-helix repeat protein